MASLTRRVSIIHKLIMKEKQYLRDLDTVESVSITTGSESMAN